MDVYTRLAWSYMNDIRKTSLCCWRWWWGARCSSVDPPRCVVDDSWFNNNLLGSDCNLNGWWMENFCLVNTRPYINQCYLSHKKVPRMYPIINYPRPARPQHDRSWMLNTPAVITRKEKDIFRFLETINKQWLKSHFCQRNAKVQKKFNAWHNSLP